MRVHSAILLVLALSVQLVNSLCPELQKVVEELPEDYMYDTEFATRVKETLKKLNHTHIYENVPDSTAMEGDEDRPAEQQMIIMD